MMLPHIGAELLALADLCEVEDKGVINGWSVDVWHLGDDALEALRELYDALLLGGIDEDIFAGLEAKGIDVNALLVGEDAARDVITRSDLTELAAAAAAIEIDEWPVDTMTLPNVPKGSRARSEVGIDILAVQLDFDSASTELLDNEVIHIGSVKHSIDDPADCRYKLVKSVSSKDLTVPYVAQQLRVLSGRLESTGINGRRVYLFLQDFPDDDHVAITITGAVDFGRRDEFLAQMEHLPQVVGSRVCRHVLFDHIDDLHELVDDD